MGQSCMMISIHAPREGRDKRARITLISTESLFQSTRPARGATAIISFLTYSIEISIHAPREGRD